MDLAIAVTALGVVLCIIGFVFCFLANKLLRDAKRLYKECQQMIDKDRAIWVETGEMLDLYNNVVNAIKGTQDDFDAAVKALNDWHDSKGG